MPVEERTEMINPTLDPTICYICGKDEPTYIGGTCQSCLDSWIKHQREEATEAAAQFDPYPASQLKKHLAHLGWRPHMYSFTYTEPHNDFGAIVIAADLSGGREGAPTGLVFRKSYPLTNWHPDGSSSMTIRTDPADLGARPIREAWPYFQAWLERGVEDRPYSY